jgi:cell division protein FtsL
MTPPAAAAAPAVHPRRPSAPGRPRTAPGRPRTAPARPRRVSGPARPVRRTPDVGGGIALGLLGALEGLSRHRLLDRLIRGRTSIALVAFALIGIVTLQLGLLKLNSSIGHTLERESLLQRENAALSIENSELAAGERVESRAVALGMQLVPIGSLRFLTARPGADATHGAAALKTPVAATGGEAPERTAHASGTEAGAAPAASGTEQTASTTAPAAPATGESAGTQGGEPSHASGEAASAPASAPAAPASQPQAAPSTPPGGSSGGGAAEATPAGGTQATPAG